MLKSKKFWSYEICECQAIPEDAFTNFKTKGKFIDDANYFYDQLGCGIHPALKKVVYRDTPQVSFTNVLVDHNTIKILFHLIPNSKIGTLRFSSNYFTISNFELLITSLLKSQNIYNFSYEYNEKIIINGLEYSIKDLDSMLDEKVTQDLEKSQNLLISLFASEPYRLEAVCLRGNYIGDDSAIKIFEALKKNDYLRILNLYKNDLTDKCMKSFGEMLLVNRHLEEINLGNNYLTDEALENVKVNTGKFLLSEEELEEYNRILKEKQEIIKKNEKLVKEKKPELEIPFLDELETTPEGQNFKVRNGTVKILNIIQNKFTEKCFDNIEYILNNNKQMSISMDLRSFNDDQRLHFVDEGTEYKDRIYLLK